MNKVQALHYFWSSFGIKAYDENTVPDDAQLPYITYEVSEDDFNHDLGLTASIWDRSTSWSNVTNICNQIAEYITKGGKMIKYDDGAMWIRKSSPWAQRFAGDDDMTRRIILNIEVEFLD